MSHEQRADIEAAPRRARRQSSPHARCDGPRGGGHARLRARARGQPPGRSRDRAARRGARRDRRHDLLRRGGGAASTRRAARSPTGTLRHLPGLRAPDRARALERRARGGALHRLPAPLRGPITGSRPGPEPSARRRHRRDRVHRVARGPSGWPSAATTSCSAWRRGRTTTAIADLDAERGCGSTCATGARCGGRCAGPSGCSTAPGSPRCARRTPSASSR